MSERLDTNLATELLHSKYNAWLDDMSKRDGAELVSFELDVDKYPEQDFRVTKVEAEDPYKNIPDAIYYQGFRLRWMRSMGAIAYNQLLHQLKTQPTSSDDSRPLLSRLQQDRSEGKNTMIVTSHFSFPELGYFKALRFQARHDRPDITNNGVVINKLMTRQSYKGKPLVEHFKMGSNLYFSYPKTASSEKFDIPEDIMLAGNRLMLRDLVSDLRRGGQEIDIALTGRQIVPVRSDIGSVDRYDIPDIDPSSVGLVRLFDNVLGATIIRSPIDGKIKMEIGELIDIKDRLKTNSPEELVDQIYLPVAESVERITGVETTYQKLGRVAVGQG